MLEISTPFSLSHPHACVTMAWLCLLPLTATAMAHAGCQSAHTLWLRMALLAVLLFAFGVRLQELTRQDIWWDEARNIDVALRPFWQIPIAPELISSHLSTTGCCTVEWLVWRGDRTTPTALASVQSSLSVFAGNVASPCCLCWLVACCCTVAVLGGLLAALVGATKFFWLAESHSAHVHQGLPLRLAAIVPALCRTHKNA